MQRVLIKVVDMRCLMLLMVALSACVRDSGPHDRSVLQSQFDTLWVVGGDTDAQLHDLGDMAIDSTFIYVVEWGGRRIVALDRHTGALAWSVGAKGAGPGEFQRPGYLRPLPEGGVGVIDLANQRITRISEAGVVAGSTSTLEARGAVDSYCVLPNGNYLVSLIAQDSVAEIDVRGHLVRRVPLPWGYTDPTGLLTQTMLVSHQYSGNCAAALFRGIMFSSYVDGRFTQPIEYVETWALPKLHPGSPPEDSLLLDRIAVWDASMTHDTLWVAFGGLSTNADRWVDGYELSTGIYLGSILLPHRSTGVVVRGDVIIARFRASDDTEYLYALRRRRNS